MFGTLTGADARTPSASPTISASPSSSRTSSATSSRTAGWGGSTSRAEDLARFGCAADVTGPRDAVGALVRFEAERAEGLVRRGLELLPLLDRRSRACVGAMAGIYRRLLVRIDADPTAVLDRPAVAADLGEGAGSRPAASPGCRP